MLAQNIINLEIGQITSHSYKNIKHLKFCGSSAHTVMLNEVEKENPVLTALNEKVLSIQFDYRHKIVLEEANQISINAKVLFIQTGAKGEGSRVLPEKLETKIALPVGAHCTVLQMDFINHASKVIFVWNVIE